MLSFRRSVLFGIERIQSSVVLMEKWKRKVDSGFSIYLFALLRRSYTLQCDFRIISDVQSNWKTLYELHETEFYRRQCALSGKNKERKPEFFHVDGQQKKCNGKKVDEKWWKHWNTWKLCKNLTGMEWTASSDIGNVEHIRNKFCARRLNSCQ